MHSRPFHHIVPWPACISFPIPTSHARIPFFYPCSQLILLYHGSEIPAHYAIYSQRRWRDILASPRSEWGNSWGRRWWEGKNTSGIRRLRNGFLPIITDNNLNTQGASYVTHFIFSVQDSYICNSFFHFHFLSFPLNQSVRLAYRSIISPPTVY
jgi:hypothetical protein